MSFMGHSFAEAFAGRLASTPNVTATLPPRSHRYFQFLIGIEVTVFVRTEGISNPTVVNVTSTPCRSSSDYSQACLRLTDGDCLASWRASRPRSVRKPPGTIRPE